VVDVREGGEEGPGEAVEAFNVGLRLACDMDDEGRGEQLPHLRVRLLSLCSMSSKKRRAGALFSSEDIATASRPIEDIPNPTETSPA
jgi:hypothetical protein